MFLILKAIAEKIKENTNISCQIDVSRGTDRTNYKSIIRKNNEVEDTYSTCEKSIKGNYEVVLISNTEADVTTSYEKVEEIANVINDIELLRIENQYKKVTIQDVQNIMYEFVGIDENNLFYYSIKFEVLYVENEL